MIPDVRSFEQYLRSQRRPGNVTRVKNCVGGFCRPLGDDIARAVLPPRLQRET